MRLGEMEAYMQIGYLTLRAQGKCTEYRGGGEGEAETGTQEVTAVSGEEALGMVVRQRKFLVKAAQSRLQSPMRS
jgi:hypothetical protein